MRWLLVVLGVLALLSCRSTPNQATAATNGPPFDEAALKTMTHAFLDAYDQADEDRFTRTLGPTFVLLDEREVRDRDALVQGMHARRERKAPARSRTYGEERVWLGADSAVFFGEAVEHYPPDGARPTGDFDGWTTLVWVRDGAAWKVASWQWIKGGLDAAREEWNATYREGHAFNPRPSKFLGEMVSGRKPGLALDVAMGQGRNALYLAAQGWQVTGIDISEEGLRHARAAAAAQKLHIEAINADADKWDYGENKWDVIALIYAGCDAKMADTVRKSLKPGGIVVIEGFHKDALPIGFTTGELSARFRNGFKVLRDDVVDDVSDWGNQKGVPQKLVRFAAEKL